MPRRGQRKGYEHREGILSMILSQRKKTVMIQTMQAILQIKIRSKTLPMKFGQTLNVVFANDLFMDYSTSVGIFPFLLTSQMDSDYEVLSQLIMILLTGMTDGIWITTVLTKNDGSTRRKLVLDCQRIYM